MLFKILHGDSSRISTEITPFHEGYCYVTHDGYMYIDINIGTKESPNNQRIKLNAKDAETLLGRSLDQVENKSSATIRSEITKENVISALGYTPAEGGANYSVITNDEIDEICNATITTFLNSIAAEGVSF